MSQAKKTDAPGVWVVRSKYGEFLHYVCNDHETFYSYFTAKEHAEDLEGTEYEITPEEWAEV